MGCYDSVIAQCPVCNKDIEFQSKAGECSLIEYNIENTPLEILFDIQNRCVECKCGNIVSIHTHWRSADTIIYSFADRHRNIEEKNND